jgi:hypothetical protein
MKRARERNGRENSYKTLRKTGLRYRKSNDGRKI